MIIANPVPTLVSGETTLPGGTRCRFDGTVQLFKIPPHADGDTVAGQVLRLAALLNALLAPARLVHMELEVPASAPRADLPLIGLRAWPRRCRTLLRHPGLWYGGVDALHLQVTVDVVQVRPGKVVMEATGRLAGLADRSAHGHGAFEAAAASCATAAAEIFAPHPAWIVASGLRSIGFRLDCPREEP